MNYLDSIHLIYILINRGEIKIQKMIMKMAYTNGLIYQYSVSMGPDLMSPHGHIRE